MKKYAPLALALIMAMATQADAFSIGNLKFKCPKYAFWCGGDHDKDRQVIRTPEPNPPVHNVPEPASIILFSIGVAGLAVSRRVFKR